MRDHFHPPIEEYLQVIESLTDEGVTVIQARVAERLNKSAPSVKEMIDRLRDEGYLSRGGRELLLTPRGHEIARHVIRKHRLAERLLADVIGLPWHLIHEEAGRWEHVISDEAEARIATLLGDPGTCPHGNPITGSAHVPESSANQSRLSDRGVGDVVRFARLSEEGESDPQALRELSDAGFLPGVIASLRTKDAEGTIVLKVNEDVLRVRRKLSQQLFVVPA